MIVIRGIYPPTPLGEERPRVENYLKTMVDSSLKAGLVLEISTYDLLSWIRTGKCSPPPGVDATNRISLANYMSFLLLNFRPENGCVKKEVEGRGFVYRFMPNEDGVQ